jgi:hypothetical protein
VLRIISLKGSKIDTNEHFLEKVASFLVSDYFDRCGGESKKIVAGLAKLFEV